MILGFDFLGFQAIKRFPTKNRIFLHIMQSTITNNSSLLVFYPYVTDMYLVCTRMLLVCTRISSYVTRMYLYVTRLYSCGVLVMIPLCVVLSPLDDSMLHYSNKQNISSTIPPLHHHFHARRVDLARRVDAAWILSYKSARVFSLPTRGFFPTHA